jgi:ubiquinone/menaquinone biosynthesis C-methylase UbiE
MIGRDVYSSGEYVGHFRPDDGHNPLHGLYAAKCRDVIASVRASLPAGGRVLDLGGGPGRMAVPLAREYRVTLCDISPDMLRIASAAAEAHDVPAGNLVVRQLDASDRLPFSSAHFDRVLCIDLLVHLKAPVSLLRELHRVLKPDGELIVDMSNSSPWWILRYPRTLGRRPGGWLSTWKSGGVLPEWQSRVRHHSRTEFRSMLGASRLEIVEERRYGPPWCAKWFLTRCRPLPG